MRRNFFSAVAVFVAALVAAISILPARAQVGTPDTNFLRDEGQARHRSEFISYDIRGEAEREAASGEFVRSKYFRPLQFKLDTAQQLYSMFKATVEIPELWLDRDVYIRDTGRTGRYQLIINGEEAGLNTDGYSTNDYLITPYLQGGENEIALVFTDDVPGAEMERGADAAFSGAGAAIRGAIKNLYIFSQPRIHIFDYTAVGRFDDEVRDNVIDLAVIMVNGGNMPEVVTVGYDVYTPDGRLKEYSFRDVTIPGRGCDTVRFVTKITGAAKLQYSAANPALWQMMLSLRHQGRNTEYIPFRLGFGQTSFDGERILRGGVPIEISAVKGDFPTSAGMAEKLRAAKKRGVNTVYVTRPQQKWFYDLTERLGLYVIDRAAVECENGEAAGSGGLSGGEVSGASAGGGPKNDYSDRAPGGTAANDPAFLPRFLDRQQAMFYRNRNRPNVIGWSIGGESGNGYNMYKSYRLLRSLDPSRPVIYPFAQGEWNSDMELPAAQPLK